MGHKLLPTLVAAMTAAGLTACGMADAEDGAEPDQLGVCVDPNTELRVDDDLCGDYDDDGHSSSGFFFLWMSTGSSHSVPAVGSKVPVAAGSRTLPPGARPAVGAPRAGGPMGTVRGGLGVSSKGGSGGS